MNILFVTAYDVSPQKGGTERVIHSLSNGLCADFGVKCYLAYYDEIEKHYDIQTGDVVDEWKDQACFGKANKVVE